LFKLHEQLLASQIPDGLCIKNKYEKNSNEKYMSKEEIKIVNLLCEKAQMIGGTVYEFCIERFLMTLKFR
jgi:hypothetical protein